MNKKQFKNSRAITLIALVITIVVLLILAGIALNLVLGDNGIIAKSKVAKKTQSSAEVESDVQIAFAECFLDKDGNNAEITASDLQNKLIEKGYTDTQVTLEDGVFTITIGTDTFIRNLEGEFSKLGQKPTITGVKVVGNSNGTGDNLAAGTVDSNTTPNLYIMFTAETTEEGATISKIQVKGIEDTYTDITLPYQVTSNGTYEFKAISSTGRSVTAQVTVNQFQIVLQQGDFIDYDAGTWTQEEINSLGTTLYSGTSNPTSSTPYKFGGFGVGTEKSPNGWIILKVNNDGTILITTAKEVEKYYHKNETNSGYKSEYILNRNSTNANIPDSIKNAVGNNTRNWDMYKNTDKGAEDAHCMILTEVKYFASKDAAKTGNKYWYASAYRSDAPYLFGRVDENGAWGAQSSGCFGVRPVVALRSGIQITGGTGEDYANRYTYTYND